MLKKRPSNADLTHLLEEEKKTTERLTEERNALREMVEDLWQQLKATKRELKTTRLKFSKQSDAKSKKQRALLRGIRNLGILAIVKNPSHDIFVQPRYKPLLSRIWSNLAVRDLIGRISPVCRAWGDSLAHGTRFWKMYVQGNCRWTTSTAERGLVWQRLARSSDEFGIAPESFAKLVAQVHARQLLRSRESSVGGLKHNLRQVRRQQEDLLHRLLTEARLSSSDKTFWGTLQSRESELQQQLEDLGGSNPFKPNLSPAQRDEYEINLSKAIVLIESDACRTFSESRLRYYMHPQLRSPSTRGERQPRFHDKATFIASLKNVLGAFCIREMDIGYCQGMNFLAGLFLLFMDELASLRTLTAMMHGEKYRFAQIYKPGLVNVRMFFFQLNRIILSVLPKLHRRLQEEGIQVDMFASSWVMTMFVSFEPMPLQGLLRIWDLFLVNGWEIVFQLATCLLYRKQKELLSLDFAEMLERLNRNLASDCRSANKIDEYVSYGRDVLGITRHMLANLRQEFLDEGAVTPQKRSSMNNSKKSKSEPIKKPPANITSPDLTSNLSPPKTTQPESQKKKINSTKQKSTSQPRQQTKTHSGQSTPRPRPPDIPKPAKEAHFPPPPPPPATASASASKKKSTDKPRRGKKQRKQFFTKQSGLLKAMFNSPLF